MSAVEAPRAPRRSPRHFAIREEPAEYVIELDVSDFSREQVSVEATGHRVTVRGERPSWDDSGIVVHERLVEWFRLPDDADGDDVSAAYGRGTLEVHARRHPVTRHEVAVQRSRFATDVPKGC
jgi:HSP20 family molecular chaperone IbpA